MVYKLFRFLSINLKLIKYKLIAFITKFKYESNN